ncbi:TPA: hypothetical protein DIS56_04065 [Candidatus Saccharibacteria bacterium]|nr:MAG: Glycosyl transferase, family 2 [Candidatus Saccharibacteria bacterium GW2011_GWA2_46_10]OGL36090.1 MAG: hypothetical protein A3F05_00325 [Candidatus Saccharibacteria bacterium RIFCSPHIGHO2_12_FULL_47_17]HCM52269.1 hypothetical protein [Candidatus Saccharibacteria bacterium]
MMKRLVKNTIKNLPGVKRLYKDKIRLETEVSELQKEIKDQLAKAEHQRLSEVKRLHRIDRERLGEIAQLRTDLFQVSHYLQWIYQNSPLPTTLRTQSHQSARLSRKPKMLAIIINSRGLTYEVESSIQSLLGQSYKYWQAVILSNKPLTALERKYNDNKAISFIEVKSTHVTDELNKNIDQSRADFVGIVGAGDQLWPNALYEFAAYINQYPGADCIYSDEEYITIKGKTVVRKPFFKPEYSLDSLRSINYIGRFNILRCQVAQKIRFKDFNLHVAEWDLLLRLDASNEKILHIDKILYSNYNSKIKQTKGGELAGTDQVLEQELLRQNLQGNVTKQSQYPFWRVQYTIKDSPLVSIIIPTKNQYEYIHRCLSTLLQKTTYRSYEIVIVDTGTNDEKVLQLYKDISVSRPKTRVVYWKGKFSFSGACNLGAKEASGDYYLFLNNDTEIIAPDWLENMLEQASRPGIGAVGCKLLYPDRKVQHCGVVIGKGGVAGHLLRGWEENPDDISSMFYINSTRNTSAVTGACMLIDKTKFWTVKGFDEKLRVTFNDADLCLKLMEEGWLNIYTPLSTLIHYESVSIGQPDEQRRDQSEFRQAIKFMEKKWGEKLQKDKFFNRNFYYLVSDSQE